MAFSITRASAIMAAAGTERGPRSRDQGEGSFNRFTTSGLPNPEITVERNLCTCPGEVNPPKGVFLTQSAARYDKCRAAP